MYHCLTATLVLSLWPDPPTGGAGAPPAVEPAADFEAVRMRLNGRDFKQSRKELLRMGASAFPAYEAIIADPESPPGHVARAFFVLSAIDADRRRFLDPAIERLADTNRGVRSDAVLLLGRIGTDADMTPVVPLLDDEDIVVQRTAAETLAAAGGKRTLAALNVWLRVAAGRETGDIEHFRHVRDARDALAKRLKDAPPPKVDAPAKK